jgi:fermentation-respiration switch protein FrsA (DUF1100 family)
MRDLGAPPRLVEPLSLRAWPAEAPAGLSGLRARRIEFTSRGDLVGGRLLLPPSGDGPFPLILLQHGAGGSKEAEYLDATAGPWARGGAAVLSIDFPLHGERRSAKLTERVLAALARPGALMQDAALWSELVRQAVADLGRALDAAARLPELDARSSARRSSATTPARARPRSRSEAAASGRRASTRRSTSAASRRARSSS